MFDATQNLIDAIPYPIAFGCIAIGLGVIATGFASPIKSRADRAKNSKKPERQMAGRRLQARFIIFLIFGGVLTAFGTLLTINGGRLNAEEQSSFWKQSFNQLQSKLSTVLFALNAEREEKTRLLTEETIKVFSNDLIQWAEDFTKRKPDKQRQFEQLRVVETQKEIQVSSESAPLFSVITRFVEEAAKAYAKQSGEAFEIKMPVWPQNFYDVEVRNEERLIRFGEKSLWTFHIYANAPASDDNLPLFRIDTMNPNGRSGNLDVRRVPKAAKFVISGSGTLPVPEATSMFQEYDLDGFEQTIQRIFRRFLEAQIAETPTATPSPAR